MGPVLFDRLIASTRVLATAVFTIYIADAVGLIQAQLRYSFTKSLVSLNSIT